MEVVTKKKIQPKNDRMLPSIGLGASASKKEITKINFIQKDDIKTGVLFLGFVLQIEEKSAVISAPNGHTAILHVQDLSDVIHDICARRNADESNVSHQEIPDLRHLLELHQPIRCCVLPMNEKRGRLQVSSRSSLINRGLALKHLNKGFLLSGCVMSIEDHGCIISTGIPDVNFFLPKRGKDDSAFIIGQQIDCIVDDVNSQSRTVTLQQRKNNYHDAPLSTKSLPFLALSPGMLFEVLVDKKVPTGYIVNYLSLFHGVIDRYSTYKIYSDSEWEELGNKENTLLARVIFVDHASKTVRLSCRPHVLSLRKPSHLPPLGSMIEQGAVIMRSKHGAFLRLADTSDATAAETTAEGDKAAESRGNKKQRKQKEEEAHLKAEQTVNIIVKATELADIGGGSSDGAEAEEDAEDSTSDDSSIEGDAGNKKKVSKSEDAAIKKHKIHNVYTVGRVIPVVRVQGFRLVEGIVTGSNMKKYVQNSIMHVSDVRPGQIVTAEVTEITPAGLVLTIGGRVTAFCPIVHTSDSATAETKLHKKFSVGQKLSMRVLNKNQKGRVIVTHKKSLLDLEEHAVFVDYATVPERQETNAVVESIDNTKGVGLRFFCDVHGLLPLPVLMKQGVLNPQEAYRVGQVVRVITLTTIHPAPVNANKKSKKNQQQTQQQGKVLCALAFVLSEEKLLELFQAISPLLPSSASSETKDEENNDVVSNAFEFVSGAVMGITEDAILVRLDDGRTAVLPKVHCHDFAFAAASLNIKDKAHYPYKIGTRIEKALVLGLTNKKQLLLTLKPLLLHAADGSLGEEALLPKDGSGISQGSVCVGYVKKVDDFGVIVGFRDAMAGLIPRSHLADRFVSAEERLFAEGDSIRCVVIKVDQATQRYLLTTKASVVPKYEGGVQKEYSFLHAYLKDMFISASRSHAVSGSKLLPDWRNYRLGSVVTAAVSSVEEYGVVFLGQDQTTMMLDRSSGALTSGAKVGQSVELLVLDIDYEHCVLLVRQLTSSEANAYKQQQEASSSQKGQSKKNKKSSSTSSSSSVEASRALVGVSQEVHILAVGDKYLVVSTGALVGVASLADFHATRPDVSGFHVGDKLAATLQQTGSHNMEAEFPHAHLNIFSLDIDPLTITPNEDNGSNRKKKAKTAKVTESSTSAPEQQPFQEGDLVEGTIDLLATHAFEPPAIRVRLSNGWLARLCFTEVADIAQWENFADVVALWQQFQLDAAADADADEDKQAARKQQLEAALRRLRKKSIQHGKAVRARVLSVNGHRIDVSLRPSRLNAEKVGLQTKADAMPSVGDIVRGYIHNVSSKGCFVRLSHGVKGRSLIKDLSDDFVENPEETFPTGQLVHCRVSRVDLLTGHVSLVLKNSVVQAAEENKKMLSKLKAGMTVKGIVENVKDIGVFVRIDGTNIVGLARTVAALQDASKTLQEEYAAGDVVRARVLKVSPKAQRVALGLREKYFHSDYELEDIYKNDSEAEEDNEADDSDIDEEEGDSDVEEDDEDDAVDINEEEDDDEEDDEADSEESDEEEVKYKASSKLSQAQKKAAVKAVDYDSDDFGEAVEVPKSSNKKNGAFVSSTAPVKAVSKKRKHAEQDEEADEVASDDDSSADELGDLDWGDKTSSSKVSNKKNSNKKAKFEATSEGSDDKEEEEESDFGEGDSDSDEEGHNKDKKTSRKKDADRKKHEKELRARELALAEGRLLPDSVNDFERLIIGQPNSSFLWIQYIAFHVKNADIDAARVIANRALRTIHFREEDEKFNVWVALLNMEYRYGTRESFERALVQAVNESKGKLIFLSLATSMEQARDVAGAESLFEKALKRPQFRKSKKVWMAYHLLKLKHGDIAGAKAQLSRSLQALSPHKHVEVIRHFATAEFDVGSVDRARVLFEELLSNYPKRNDLWNVYVDKEVKMGNIVQARQLFERMISLKVSPKVMKTVFKKYLDFENNCGDVRSQELVKQKAREYVNSIA
jgi:rRNA biogenesis protein RRP5